MHFIHQSASQPARQPLAKQLSAQQRTSLLLGSPAVAETMVAINDIKYFWRKRNDLVLIKRECGSNKVSDKNRRANKPHTIQATYLNLSIDVRFAPKQCTTIASRTFVDVCSIAQTHSAIMPLLMVLIDIESPHTNGFKVRLHFYD